MGEDATNGGAEEALYRDAQLLRRVLEAIPTGVFVADAQGRIVLTNPAVRRIWGGAHAVAPDGYAVYRGWWADSGAPIAAHEWALARALEWGEVSLDEAIEIEAFDGTRKTVLNSALPLYDADGSVVGAIATNVDITERRRLEREVARSRDFLAKVMDGVSNAVAVVDRSGRLLQVNRQVAPLTGYTDRELLGRHFRLLLEAPARPAMQALFSAVVTRGDSVLGRQVAIRRKDGGARTVAFNAVPLYEGERIDAVVVTAEDISERLRTERVLAREAEALAAVNRELEAFAYSVSHDLRAPLRALNGLTRILLEEHAERLDDDGRGLLTRIGAAAERLSALVDALLGLARVARQELTRERVDLAAMARELFEELRHGQPQRKVALRIAPDLGARGDPRLLRVALANLLANAWKYTGRSADPRIEVGCRRQGGERVYFVCDNGAGFDMARAEELFTPFRRLHTEADFPGTGIGLATVQRVVRRHGGRVWAQAAPGRGACFFFTLGGGPEG